MRFVIRAPNGAYFTEFEVLQTRAVTLNGVYVGTESDMRPKFEAFSTKQAIKFATEADALWQIENTYPLHGGLEVFQGCTVHPTED